MNTSDLLRAIQSKDFVAAGQAFNATIADKMRGALSREYQTVATTWLGPTTEPQAPVKS